MQAEFRRVHRETGATMVYVTHDQAAALALADRVAVMNAGVVHQVDTPRALFDRPATRTGPSRCGGLGALFRQGGGEGVSVCDLGAGRTGELVARGQKQAGIGRAHGGALDRDLG